MLRVAIIRGHRPTTLLFRVQPRSKWAELDYVLLEAYQMYEDESNSGGTGIPAPVALSNDSDLIFVVEEMENHAQTELEAWRADQAASRAKQLETNKNKKFPTIVPIVVAKHADGTPFEYDGLTRHALRMAAIQEERDSDLPEDALQIDLDRPEGGWDPAEYGDGVTDPD